MLKNVAFIFPLLALSGCTWSLPTPPPDLGIRTVVDSVAIKAIGTNAYSVNPFRGINLEVPAIYAIRDNGTLFQQLCENDTIKQNAINTMGTRQFEESGIIEDGINPVSIRLNILGGTYESPYTKLKVSGYKITRLLSGDSGSAAAWVLDNVADKCRDEILPKNRPYIVVEQIAVANNIETVSGGGFGEVKFGLGPIGGGSFELDDAPPRRATQRVFAISGKVVE